MIYLMPLLELAKIINMVCFFKIYSLVSLFITSYIMYVLYLEAKFLNFPSIAKIE